MVIAACGSGAAHRGRTVVYASGADLQSVNPLLTVHPLAKQVERYVLLTTLVRYDSTLVSRPYLARAWTWSEDRKSLTFRLQPGVRWGDGVPTTARDVAWTLSAARDAATGYPRLNDFADVAFVNDPNDSTVVIRFAHSQDAIPDVLTDLAILPARWLDSIPRTELRRADWNEHPIGNGPFRFVAHEAGRRWVFAANPDFPAALGGPPALERFIVVVVDEPTTKLAALTSGEIDFAGIQPAHAAFVRKNPALAVLDYPLIMPYGIVFNTRKPPFDEPRVRLAGRSWTRLFADARRAGGGPTRPRSCQCAALVPGFTARRIPLPRTGRAGDEPPGERRADGHAGGVADHRGVADGAVRRRDQPTEFHATAPVRLDFAGGWTDVPPFSAREGGVVVNGAIELTARVAVRVGGRLIRLVSEDLGEELECADSGGLVLDGRLDLLKAALRMLPVQAACTITTRFDAPPGSGLGSSGAMDVALVAALALARAEQVTAREIAEQAWYLETIEAKIPGGKQDQFAAALGGFQRLTFRDPDVGVEPITLDPAFATALARRTVLCYTGRSRVSGATIARVMAAYERGDPRVTGALRAMKDVAAAMVEALRAGDVARVAMLLSHNWTHQQALDPEMRTPEMAQLENALTAAGALGGKAAGAGAGGSMFFVTGDDPAPAIAAGRAAGATVLPVRWALEGVRAW